MHNEHFEELAALEALGVPLGDEADEFHAHLADCDKCRELLSEFASVATTFASTVPRGNPRPELRDRILRSVRSAGADVSAKGGRAERDLVSRAQSSSVPAWLFALAASLLLLLVGLDDARLRRQREELRSQTADLSSRLDSAQQNLARRDLQVRVLESDDVRLLYLGGKGPQPNARARVFWSPKAKRSVLVAGHLDRLPPGKQYELWAFVGAKPVRAGVFDADPAGRALFETAALAAVSEAQNFAVTVEPQGGTSAPTGPIVLIGAP